MDDSAKARILAIWNQLPEECRLRRASDDELVAFESKWMPIPADFRWFLAACGGGPVGSEWIDNIDKLHESHAKFEKERGPGGWTIRDFFTIGWDGGGNPYGIRISTGQIVVEDHDFGGVHVLAPSFQAFLLAQHVPAAEPSRRTRA